MNPSRLILSCTLLCAALISCGKVSTSANGDIQAQVSSAGLSSSWANASSTPLASSMLAVSSSVQAFSGSSVMVSSSSNAALSRSSPVQNSSSAQTLSYGILVDSRDGQTYKTIQIGTQTWMAQNLNYGTMVKGSLDQTNEAVVEKYCYGDSLALCDTDGGLYEWAEAMGLSNSCRGGSCYRSVEEPHQGLCPNGWHVPTVSEWNSLETNLGGSAVLAGKKMRLNTTGFTDWDAKNNDGNSSGFSALPSGERDNDNVWNFRGAISYFWTATENDAGMAKIRYMSDRYADLYAVNYSKNFGFSLRCLQNTP